MDGLLPHTPTGSFWLISRVDKQGCSANILNAAWTIEGDCGRWDDRWDGCGELLMPAHCV